VKVSDRCFVDDEGRPVFWLGDTQWELFCDLPPEDARAVLARRAEQGFSVVQAMITGVGEGSRPNAAGEPPWRGGDPARPNEAYFRNVDAVVETAGRLGLILVLGVYHQTQRERITTDNARPYARFLAERYADAPHVVWTMYPEAEEHYVPVMRELASGLREGDEGRHLITVHPDPAPASSSFVHEEPWLDFNMIQTWHDVELIHPMVSADRARVPVKPVVMAEGTYEDAAPDEGPPGFNVRRQAYWSYLAGGGHSYGHHANWRSAATWRDWIDSPGVQGLGVCRKLLTGLDRWWSLVPDQSLFATGQGEGLTLNAAARAPDGAWALVYLSGPATVSLRVEALAGAPPARASWIDPATGEPQRIGQVATAVAEFQPPEGRPDALLLLESSGD
jgi:hypothetical protein